MDKRRPIAAVLFILNLLLVTLPHPAHGEERAPAKDKALDPQRSAFRVVIDVGHTVGVPGADSARGVPEYTFNLRLAEAVKQALIEAGFDKTVELTTATAPWRGLVERATRANAMHADLFISLHHDSVPDKLIEKWDYEGQQHQFSDRFSGYSIFISNENGDRKGSLAFGHLLGKALQALGLHYTPHYTLPLMGKYRHDLVDAEAGVYRYDQLIVLRETRMPAVLLEAGSIVNRQEELEMATPERRALISAAIASAVKDFCVAHTQPSSEAAPIKRLPPSVLTPSGAKPAALIR
ncbi:MAG TPA: N-acetylmuramoyl-L-alanine amidase [Xanthobacteraceae bacterium]|nr:N-acetylmuramoyl-L-alanine amidase [Xanthobacteraceae bacterium]